MTPDQRLRLFAALLGEGRALVLAEAGETDRTLAWARNIDAALAEYRGEAQQCKAWCGSKGTFYDGCPVGVICFGRTNRHWCSSACRDAGRPLNPPVAEVPPGQVAVPKSSGDAPCAPRCVFAGQSTHPDECQVPPGQVAGEETMRAHVAGSNSVHQFTPAPAAPAKASEPAKVPLQVGPTISDMRRFEAKVAALEAQLATAEGERDAANERANETGCELDGVRAEVEQLRAKLEEVGRERFDLRDALENEKLGADARVLAMRDACAKVARDQGREYTAWAIERLPVGAGKATPSNGPAT